MSNVPATRNGEWYQDLYGWPRPLRLATGVLDLGAGCVLKKVPARGKKASEDVALPGKYVLQGSVR